MIVKNRIKIWPFWDDISPSIIPYYDSNLNSEKTIFIDFSGVKRFTSSGCSIIIAKLIKIINELSGKYWNIYFGENHSCESFLNNIGANSIITQEIPNKDLFCMDSQVDKLKEVSIGNTISFPIYKLNHTKSSGRESVELFIEWLVEELYEYFKNTNLRFDLFLKMLKEIAKNSCDHTGKDAFFGIDIINNTNSNYIMFSYCDLGIGIHHNVKKYKEKYGEDWSKKGIVDSYHFAFQPFNTTGGAINKGIGMSMIKECSQLLMFHLCIFDANSMGIVPPEIVHSVIRDNFYNTGSAVGFNYFGIVNFCGQ